MTAQRHVVSDREATAEERAGHIQWLSRVRAAARSDPKERFRNPGPAIFRQRLLRAARRYAFTLKQVTFRHPDQLAPDIIIESDRYIRLAHDLGSIEDVVDPAHPPLSNQRDYEALFVVCVDSHGIPYAEADLSLRGQVAGGQWARADALYPFSHG